MMLLSILMGSISILHASTDIHSEAKRRWLEGDARGVISVIEPWLDTNSAPYGSERDALRLLLGEAYSAEGDWGLAARQYSIVRGNKRTLSTFALMKVPWFHFQAKEFWTAKKRCEQIRSRYPKSDEAIDCLKLIGMSYGEMGHIRSSRSYFDQYLAAVPQSPFRESLELLQAEYTFRKDPDEGRILLYHLFFNHHYPTTDAKIIEVLGEPFPITTLEERTARMYSFIKGNRMEEAWQLYTEVQEIEAPTPEQTQWLSDYLRDVSWRTRHFDAYITLVKAVYETEQTSENAYRIFRAYCKAGRWEEASIFGTESLNYFGRRGRWAGARDEIARAMMFAGHYSDAAAMWGQMHGYGSKFYQAFSTYMNAEYQQAIELFTPLTTKSNAWDAAAFYWMGRAQEHLKQDASKNFEQAMALDSSGWYDLLVLQRLRLSDAPQAENHEYVSETITHQGVWYLNNLSDDLEEPSVTLTALPEHSSASIAPYHASTIQQSFDWNTFSTPQNTPVISSTNIWPSRYEFPDPYLNPVFGTEDDLQEVFADFVTGYKQTFPNLPETALLVSVGMYPEAARNMQANYLQWETSNKKPAISMDLWRNAFLYTRTHHYVLRYTTNMEQYFEDPALIRQVQQINHPLVRPADMWSLTKQYNVDPWLMMGLMRQESAYRETVRSWVGAIGYIQVMPATGAKVAFLLNEASYSPQNLENPQTNLKYGIFYFSKLMERFDDAYPLAVGSYNGGPHNMSRWYRNRMGTWEMDEFVEHIPYDETRRYIKKVTGHYSHYVDLYFDDHTVAIPNPPTKDDPTVIDF